MQQTLGNRKECEEREPLSVGTAGTIVKIPDSAVEWIKLNIPRAN